MTASPYMNYRIVVTLLMLMGLGPARSGATQPDSITTDPSAILTEYERFRFRGDFNFDGIPDVAVSGDREQFGNAGGSFEIYLGTRSGKWRYIGSIEAHSLAVHLAKRRDGKGILTAYLHASASEGSLLRYLVTNRGVKELSSREIHPGDGGTEKDRSEYAKDFVAANRLRPELSRVVDGKMVWHAYEP